MFSTEGPTLRELLVQALSSVEHGYDLLAPKFDHTPFRTPRVILDATAEALARLGPFSDGLDVCCGTGAGLDVLRQAGAGRVTGVDFSTGMLEQAGAAHPGAALVRADARALSFVEEFDLAVSFGAFGHFLPAERPALFAGVYRALRPGGLFAFPIGARSSWRRPGWWLMLGFDAAMRVRNALWRPPFVMYYLINQLPEMSADLTTAGFSVTTADLPGFPTARVVLARRPVRPRPARQSQTGEPRPVG